MIKVFVPIDDAACSVGANEVAQELETQAKSRNIEIELIRNGSRGMLWLEPLVEVEIENKRYGFANIDETKVKELFDTNFLTDKSHKLRSEEHTSELQSH